MGGSAPVTLAAAVAATRQRLCDAGIPAEEAGLDARLLAQAVLGWDSARFLSSSNEAAASRFCVAYERLVARRAAREPMAYILGQQEFWGLTFEVSPAVLIPRPETELIVEAALQLRSNPDQEFTCADVCTGSGCLAVALAHERPRARLFAGDVSAEALRVAARNAQRHGVAARIQFAESDLLAGTTERFDMIVSNPPYVPLADRPALQPEVRDYEPGVALFGGADGSAVLNRLVSQAADRLQAGGFFIFEFGAGQHTQVEQLVARTPGLALVELRHDLQGIARTAIARKL